jgi:hypothetical protein
LQRSKRDDQHALKNTESIPGARRLADEVFDDKWDGRSIGISEDGPKEVQVWGIGHCHIDSAWYVKWIVACR